MNIIKGFVIYQSMYTVVICETILYFMFPYATKQTACDAHVMCSFTFIGKYVYLIYITYILLFRFICEIG